MRNEKTKISLRPKEQKFWHLKNILKRIQLKKFLIS